MMRILLPVIFSCFSLIVLAQTDSLEVESDTVLSVEKKKVIEPSVYIDYGKAITYFSNFETKYAFGLDLRLFSLVYITGEYGNSVIEPPGAYENIDYKSDGNYFKVGLGVYGDFLVQNRLGLVARYGQSSFEDQAVATLEDQFGIVDDYSDSFERKNLSARWFELALITERKLTLNKSNPNAPINDLLGLGTIIQYRRLIDYDEQPIIDINNIPGYGKPVNKNVIAVNFIIRIYPFM
jgi:hypothetical protein